MFETILALSLGILFIAGATTYFVIGREKLNERTVTQGLFLLKLNIEQVYTNEEYAGLNNEVLMQGNLVPSGLVHGHRIMSPWGEIVVQSEVSGFELSNYSITLYDIPRNVCITLVSNIDSWDQVYAGNESTKIFDRKASAEITRGDRFAACQYEQGNIVKFVGP